MTPQETKNNKNLYLSLLKETGRDGMEDLIAWLESTDFFEAPASSKYHLAEAGGLCQHSLNVYREFIRLAKAYPEIKVSKPTAIIICLLHDLCKVYNYKMYLKNVQDKDTGKWYKEPAYTYDEKFVFGLHGGKSLYLVMKYIKLSNEEALAITNHMGAFSESPQDTARVFEKCPLAWLLHVADESASYLIEVSK